jgi:hypothetical protein
MSDKGRAVLAIILVILAVPLLSSGLLLRRGWADVASCSCGTPDVRGCTIFTVSQGDRVFFGGNGDWHNFDGNYYWVDPGDETHYGAIYFGKPDNVQQGFNEMGLAYDSNGLPLSPVNPRPGLQPVFGGYTSYPIQILRACATVEEVIDWVQTHQWHEAMHDQLHFADASGDAVVISAGPDGEIAFTRKPAGGGFLVSTNFNLANRSNGSYPCWRYDLATQLLADIVRADTLTAERAASVLDAVHVESANSWTIMSVLGDLPRGLVYVYLFHQFDAPVVLNVADEIARAPDPGPLRDLFPPETVSRVDRAYNRYVTRSTRCNAAGFTWLGLVALSLAALLVVKSNRHGLVVWAPVVIALGPVGLLVRWIATRGGQRHVFVEALGDLPPAVLGLVAAMAAAVYVPAFSQGSLIQLGAFCGLPLVIGLFVYQAPLLAGATRSNYLSMVLRRLPVALVSTNLALAGLLGASFPLIKWHLEYCGFCDLTVLQWWAIAVPGALAGGLLLTAYHAWAVRRGFAAWSAIVRGEGVSSPPWRRMWGWIVASFLMLAAGIALAIVIPALIAG